MRTLPLRVTAIVVALCAIAAPLAAVRLDLPSGLRRLGAPEEATMQQTPDGRPQASDRVRGGGGAVQNFHACARVRAKGNSQSRELGGTVGCTTAAIVGAGGRIASKGAQMPTIWGLSKRDANYGPAPTAEMRCDRCKYMFPPLALGGCRLVRGVIRGSASCKEFVPRRPARTEPET
jgi:hypothetical protein